jgi:hypothetical protein
MPGTFDDLFWLYSMGLIVELVKVGFDQKILPESAVEDESPPDEINYFRIMQVKAVDWQKAWAGLRQKWPQASHDLLRLCRVGAVDQIPDGEQNNLHCLIPKQQAALNELNSFIKTSRGWDYLSIEQVQEDHRWESAKSHQEDLDKAIMNAIRHGLIDHPIIQDLIKVLRASSNRKVLGGQKWALKIASLLPTRRSNAGRLDSTLQRGSYCHHSTNSS